MEFQIANLSWTISAGILCLTGAVFGLTLVVFGVVCELKRIADALKK